MGQAALIPYLLALRERLKAYGGGGPGGNPERYFQFAMATLEAKRYCDHTNGRGRDTHQITAPQGTYAEVRCATCDKLLRG